MPKITIENQEYGREELLNEDRGDFNAFPEYIKGYLQLGKAWLAQKNSFMFQTSGSTGKPKQMEFSRATVLNSAERSIKTFELGSGKGMLIGLPEKYVAGKMMLIRALVAGMDIHFQKPSSELVLENIPQQKKWVTSFVPMQMEKMLIPENETEFNQLFDHILLGGAALSPNLEKEIREKCEFPVYHTFGMTETLTHFAYRQINGSETSKNYTVIDGFKVSTSEVSTLQVKGEVTNGEWMTTNDVIEMVSKESFRWKGRSDNVINSGGIKLFPEAIEARIAELQVGALAGKEWFLAGVPDGSLGEKLIMVCEGSPFSSQKIASLLSAMRKSLARFEVPKALFFVENFERTDSQKIKRKAIVSALDEDSALIFK